MSAGQTKSEAALVVQQRGVLAPVFRTSGCKRRKASTEDCGYVSARAPSRDRARVTDRPAKEGGFSVALGGAQNSKQGYQCGLCPATDVAGSNHVGSPTTRSYR